VSVHFRRRFTYDWATDVTAASAGYERGIRHDWLVAVVAQLKSIHPAEASALVLSYFYGMTPTKIANELGVSEGDARHLMSRGLAQLGHAFAQRDADVIIFPAAARRRSIRRRPAIEEAANIEISVAPVISDPARRLT
jgi:hypothetical protein